MKKLLSILIPLFVFIGCEDDVEEATLAASPIEITYNIHESLPSDWVTEFNIITVSYTHLTLPTSDLV